MLIFFWEGGRSRSVQGFQHFQKVGGYFEKVGEEQQVKRG